MKLSNRNKILARQRITWRVSVVFISIAALISFGTVAVFQLYQTDKAYASDCESSYTLDWSVPATYTVTCGSVNSSTWNVKGSTCTYTSPVFEAGGTVGQPSKIADIALRVNQGGNLEGDDTCWVNFLVNGSIVHSITVQGDTTNGVFSLSHSLVVPAAGNYQVKITMKNDKTNESWYLKNGDVTACLKLTPLPLTLGNFKATAEAEKGIRLSWITFTEINNNFFTVERSANGTDFTPIKQIEGAGNSNSTIKYEYYDKDPLPERNYYRLRQTDYDGTFSFSHIITVTASGNTKKQKELKVYPNPFSASFILEFEADLESNYTLQLLTPEGKILYEQLTQAVEGINSVYCEPNVLLHKGTFILRLLHENELSGSVKLIHN